MLLLRYCDLLLLQSGHVEVAFPELLFQGLSLRLHPLSILMCLDLLFDLTHWMTVQT